ncbi:MAG: hypothetical protein SPLUMA2_SPLUMAMAG2_00100 [uncultured Sulfurimonas sp.]|nr:MAG: hypothetical protein SPLUMA2_SPLUMAMAG2_00100 [uncultured Sulfurimonas sp.]
MKKIIALLLLVSFNCSSLIAQNVQTEEKDLLTSAEDGAFDVSDYLGTRYGFLPVPTIITEPAVGYGAGLNVMFLHDTFNSVKERKSPPSISGIFVVATENGTKAVGHITWVFGKKTLFVALLSSEQ